jgi:hypothetical protein
MKKIIRLTESDLVRLVKKVIKESEDKYVVYGEADHLQGKGMFFYNVDGGYTLIPNNIAFRRRMEDNSTDIKIFNNRRDAERVRKELRIRPDIRWYIKSI